MEIFIVFQIYIQDSLMKLKLKRIAFNGNKYFVRFIDVFTSTFDIFILALVNKSIHFFKKIYHWLQTFK